jgi:D-glycero-D-manno-heptose 1,7-bisphosphate phosphatase
MSLYIFDQGNTLINTPRSRFGMRRSPTRCEEQVLLPGVYEKIAALRAQGHKIAIATNQDAVAWGTITYAEAEKLVENCAEKLGGVDAWSISPYNPMARLTLLSGHKPTPYARDHPSHKPHPGMIFELMRKLGYKAEDTIVVGDKKADERAARSAGVRFISAKDFFAQKK